MSPLAAPQTATQFEPRRTALTSRVVRGLALFFLLVILGSQGPLRGQDSACAVEGPVEGNEEIAGTTGPETAKVKVTIAENPDPVKIVYEVQASLVGDNRFGVTTPALTEGQIINVQEIKADGTNAGQCNAIVGASEEQDDACDETDTTQVCNVYVYRSVMDPQNVADIFGHRMGKRFVAVQVTVANASKEFDFVIHDLSVDLKGVFKQWPENLEKLGIESDFSSEELSTLRGVAEKGRSLDPRNLTFNILRGASTVFAAFLGVPVGGVRGSWNAVAALSTPVLTAYDAMAPDHSVPQLERLDDAAYAANTVVTRGQSKVVVAFLPQRLFMDKSARKKFWKDPTTLSDDENGPDFRKLKVIVDGVHVANVAEVPPLVTAMMFGSGEARNFGDPQPEVAGFILGRFLTGATLSIESEDLDGVTIEVTGTPSDKRVEFVVRSIAPIPSGTVLEVGIAKQEHFRTTSRKIAYTSNPEEPEEPEEPVEPEQPGQPEEPEQPEQPQP